MGKRVRQHLQSNVVGYIALFFAMSLGTAWAIEKNEVKSKHIKDGQVKEKDLGSGAVTADKLAANSVDGDNVVGDSLKGDDVDESSLNLPDPPSIPSSLPPSGAAGGDLSGEYPNPQVSESGLSAGGDLSGNLASAQLGGNTVGTGEVDGSLTGADIADAPGGSDNVNADSVDGRSIDDLARRSNVSSNPNNDFSWLAYYMDTDGTEVFEFGAIEMRTTGTDGEFQVCSNTGTTRPYMLTLNGVASSQTAQANASCTTEFDTGPNGSIMISGGSVLIFGFLEPEVLSSPPSTEDYRLIGFRQA